MVFEGCHLAEPGVVGLLTSAVAPLIRLSYGRMVYMALPYTITMSLTGLWAIKNLSYVAH